MGDLQAIEILLISSDSKEHQLLQDLLAKAHGTSLTMTWARQLSEGLERLGKGGMDIVLLDLSMQDSQGPQPLVELRAKYPQIPTVVLPAPKDGPIAPILAQGAQDFLPKELLTSSLLVHCITHAIERSRAVKGSKYFDQRFRALVENAPDTIAVLGADGRVIYDSPSYKQMLGYDESENLGISSFEFIHPDDLAQSLKDFSEAVAHPGASWHKEVRVRHKDGSWHIIETRGANRLSDPAVMGIVINSRDITDRRRAEEAYQRQMEFYKRIIEHVMDGLMVVAPDTRILYLSPTSERLFGVKSDVRTGQLSWDFLHPDDLLPIGQAYAEVLAKPGSGGKVEARYRLSDGSWGWLEAVGSNCLDDPALKGCVVVDRDITVQKRMEEALQRSQKELRQALDRLRTTLAELSTPVIQLWDNVLAMPLMGMVDDRRAQQIMEVVLKRIVETQSELVILDVTGVPYMDTMVANMMIRTIKSVSMLGAQCVLTGMKPELAHAVIDFDLDISKFIIKRDMEEALRWALDKMGYQAANGHSQLSPAKPMAGR